MLDWLRSADRKACVIRAAIYLALATYGVYGVVNEPRLSSYALVALGAVGAAWNASAATRKTS